MRNVVACLTMGAVLLAGCEAWERTRPNRDKDIELPDARTLVERMREATSLVFVDGKPMPAETREAFARLREILETDLSDPEVHKDEAIEAYQAARVKAKQQFTKELSDRIVEIRDSKQWRSILVAIQFHQYLDPEDTRFYLPYQEAYKIVGMPEITAKGATKVDDDWHVFFSVNDYQHKMVENYTVREGETFHPHAKTGKDMFRLLEIIGKNKAYEIEYLELTGHIIEVDGVRR